MNNNQPTNKAEEQEEVKAGILGSQGLVKLQDLPVWEKVTDRIYNYFLEIGAKTIDEVFAPKGNRNGLPFSTQELGNIRLVNSGSIAQSFQSWRVKNTEGDISEWIVKNLYTPSAEEKKALEEKEKHDKMVLDSATSMLDGMSVLGKPTPQIIEKAKDTIVAKVGEEVFNKLLELVTPKK